MKTTIFETKEQYLNMIKAWKESCADKSINFSSYHYAMYAILRDKDPLKCFATPEQQSKKKLACQGKSGHEAYRFAMNMINGSYADKSFITLFKDTITKEHLNLIRAELLKGNN